MVGITLVRHARAKLGDLVKEESRGWGDDNNALGRLAQHYRVPFSYLWRVLYKHRELKDVRGSVLLKIWSAHEAMCERQQNKFRTERAGAEPAGWISAVVMRAADALAGEEEEGE